MRYVILNVENDHATFQGIIQIYAWLDHSLFDHINTLNNACRNSISTCIHSFEC
jgi:hypothetical protein